MKKDPRFNNETFQYDGPFDYLKSYAKQTAEGVAQVDEKALDQALKQMKIAVESGCHVYAGGNGGSAAISDHLCCDWLKGTHVDGKPALKVHSISSNASLITALANDFGYEHSLSQQLEMLGSEGDVAILISSSGNSPNVLQAAQVARKKKMTVIGLSGFTGGKLREISDISLYVPLSNYGMVEDAHQMIMHALSQVFVQHRESK